LKDWDEDDREQGKLYLDLPVTPSGPPEDAVLLQPNIPDRLERLKRIERSRKEGRGADPSQAGD
jgi:hypothetical protein